MRGKNSGKKNTFMGYTALYMPASVDYDPSKSGFIEYDDAINYVLKHLCKGCLQDKEPLDSACAAEWMIINDEEE